MTTLMRHAVHAASNARSDSAGSEFVRRFRSSRAMASMLPSLLSSGVMTLVITAVMHLMWNGPVTGFFDAWMESWLTAWPIAFPVAYLLAPVLSRVAALTSAPAFEAANRPGLGCGDIVDVSSSVTERNGFSVLRNLKPAHDFSAV